MSANLNDPLLTAARTVLAILIALFITSIVLVGIGIVAVLSVQRGDLLQQIEAAELQPIVYWGIVAGIMGVGIILSLALRFTLELNQMVRSVAQGDPFHGANARHLERMAWYALAIQLIGFPVDLASRYLAEVSERQPTSFGLSAGGLVLVLTLLILARIFRAGTHMRDELAATV